MPHKKYSLKNDAIHALGWSSALQSSSQFISFLIGIVLARLLTPEDFGLVAMVLVFTTFSQLLTDFGLSSALIQKKTPSLLQYNSCFWFSAGAGLILALTMIGFSQNIASFYEHTELNNISICLSIIFFTNSICSVPKTILIKSLKHKEVSLIDLYSNLAGGILGLTLAFLGFSYWSLVIQQLTTNLLKAFLLIYTSDLKISLMFSFNSLRTLFTFSIYVFCSQSLRQITTQTDKILIGRYLDSATLGLYTRAYQMMLFPIANISRIISNVMFPTLSRIQDDPERIGNIYLKIIACISFLTFPMMLGLAVVAPYFIEVIFGSHWLGMTIYLQYFCFLGTLISIGTITGSIYLAMGQSKLQLKVNLINQPLQISGLLIGIQYGIKGMMIGYALTWILSLLLTWYNITRLLNLNLIQIFTALYPSMIIALSMTGLTYLVDIALLTQFRTIIKLILLILTGSFSYFILNIAFKPKAFIYLLEIAKEKRKKTNNL